MKRLKYFIITFGCQQNRADSERLATYLENQGYSKSPSIDETDCLVINTCMVRQHAEDKIYGLMKPVKLLKEKNPNFKLILTGCMVGGMVKDQTRKYFRKIRNRLPLVDHFLPIEEVGFNIPAKRETKEHAWVVISNGCNNFCSYCVVPYTRGHEISRPWADIMAEIDCLVKSGVKEITLLGQNVNSYGADLIKDRLKEGKYTLPSGKKIIPVMVGTSMGRKRIPTLFPTLLEEIAKKPFEKISFLSANPWDFSDELINVIAANKNIDRYSHLPIQSGDNKILKKMNRFYTAQDYKKLIKKIRSKISDVKIGTDIIVGFPGETEKQFESTVKLAREIGWSVAYISMYSPRPFTAPTNNLKDDITRREKSRRLEILDRIINKQKISAKI
jgi:tRNA-2-methylthio-N6-dimethylallyladenosine synthase